MNGKEEARGTGKNSGSQISDKDRGLLPPGRTSSPAKQQSSKEQGPSVPSGQSQTPPVSQQETEQLLQAEVVRLRPLIPPSPGNRWGALTNSDYQTSMSSFDSVFFYRGSDLFNFRGNVMRGSALNYYFIAMAMAHQGFAWVDVYMFIREWNREQAASRHHPLSEELISGLWFAAENGYEDEIRRLRQPPPPVRRNTPR